MPKTMFLGGGSTLRRKKTNRVAIRTASYTRPCWATSSMARISLALARISYPAVQDMDLARAPRPVLVRVRGARVGATSVAGDDYLASMSFSHGHIWRNFGILCAWWVFYAALTIIFTSRWKQMGEGGRGLLIPREKQKKVQPLLASDEEAPASEKVGIDPRCSTNPQHQHLHLEEPDLHCQNPQWRPYTPR
ncbi:hypothetical protein K491DRAFT_262032 [Lophiostoma macrostomum CBS 122681]|uniref:CDR ABC transporter domain-containing protein n=1 Tax=Lophiostoma macrostomum CBS 122681 TaxID=1314788 RepID=A0A6A6SKY2_9PLEO|nr:hypothetical protein K491DRAFT_262032 [Lophiostoma macrostomum CBS 122681]